ncbi:MAG: NAD(P)H-hydrate dehydratase, partial [Thermodesulfobacteriota bacterium]
MKLVDTFTMQKIDHKASRYFGIKELVLMENAGIGVADIVAREVTGKNRRITVLAGKGNNGGDGFVAARHLANNGFDVSVVLLTDISDVKGNARTNMDIWVKMGGGLSPLKRSGEIKRHLSTLKHSALIVDAIFGTGLASNVRGHYAKLIDTINELSRPVVSIDVPSGIDASTGRVLGHCVRANITATMAIPKVGLLTYPGSDYSGRVEVVDLGIPKVLIEDDAIPWNMVDGKMISNILKPRVRDCHKGSFGHVLVLAGSPGKTGAAYMTAMGALRAGAGLVTLGIPESLNMIMEIKTTEIMTSPLPETPSKTLGENSYNAINDLMKGKAALVLGPGLGVNRQARELVFRVIENSTIPILIDADGLNIIGGHTDILKRAKAPLIITPHPGEMARLIGIDVKSVQSDRVGYASEFAMRHNVITILKGAGTITARPDGSTYINTSGNPGMATAGTGDILSGIITGFIGQGYNTLNASVAGIYIHGIAGDIVAEKLGEAGMVATD